MKKYLLTTLGKYRAVILLLAMVFTGINGFGYLGQDFANVKIDDFIALSGREKNHEDLKFFNEIYLKNLSCLKRVNSSVKIPKVIHIIWMGPERFPLESIENVKSWKKHHPEWTWKYWSDSLVSPSPIEGMEKHLISELRLVDLSAFFTDRVTLVDAIDILKCQILYEQGGVCVDHSLKCYQPFDAFHEAYDFYAALGPPRHQQKETILSAGLFAARPSHPVIGFTIKALSPQTSPLKEEEKNRPVSSALSKSARLHLGENDIVFPSSFFYSAKTFSKKTHQILKAKGLVFASSRVSYHWKEPTTDEQAKDIFQKIRKVRDSIMYKASLLKLLFYANCVLQALIIIYIVRIKLRAKRHV